MKVFVVVAVISIGLSGCISARKYECPIDENGVASCNGVQETYRYAVANNGTKDSVMPFAKKEKEEKVAVKAKVGAAEKRKGRAVLPSSSETSRGDGGATSAGVYGFGFPDNMRAGAPVYLPPEPHRVWISPYRDKNNLLHSGETIYYVVGGRWSYGNLLTPGDGSEVMGPLMPGDYSFSPSFPAEGGESADPGVPAPEGNGVVQPYMNFTSGDDQ